MQKINNIRILSRKSDLAIIQARIVGKAIKKKYPTLKAVIQVNILNDCYESKFKQVKNSNFSV